MTIVERIAPGNEEWDDEISNHAGRYRFAGPYAADRRVLDAGCGAGHGTYLLAQSGASEVIGVDVAPEALELAAEKFPHPRVSYLQDDCERLQRVKPPFDLIVSFENIEHLQHPEQFVKRSAELLHPDGILICSTPNNPTEGRSRPQNPFHTREFNREEFVALLAFGFDEIKLFGQQLTSAYLAAHRMSMNPAFRLGAFLQRLKGHQPYRFPAPSDADWFISENALQPANFVAVCRSPRPNTRE